VHAVKRLNDDDSISGILVQLPLGPHVDPEGERTVTEAVSPEKDVDGYVVSELLSAWRSLITFTDSMLIILVIWPRARPSPYSRLAPPLVSSACLSPPECRSQALGLLYLGAVIS
jgi:hypothetical protein